MSYTIAVAGKGGTGKTSLTGLIINNLLQRGQGPILAVDADPNANLGEVLGLEVQGSIGAICDQALGSMSKVPPGMTKEDYLEYHIQGALTEADGFDLLCMGRPEGAGCYCYVNNLVRKLMDRLIRNYPLILMDNEAGLEHLSRRTTRTADLLLLISDASLRGLKTTGRLIKLIRELKLDIKKTGLIINRAGGELSPRFAEYIKAQGLQLYGVIPDDEALSRLDAEGMPLINLADDTPAAQAVNRLTDKILSEK
jgi:CO dehydrogenase maturation factor